jgi:Icc-related predicted phosphoesterase
MRIVCFADTHGYHKELNIPDGDILIFAGDMFGYPNGEAKQIKRFGKWMNQLNHAYKIMIPGNHDRIFERDYYYVTSLLENIFCLNDSMIGIGALKIWGSPITPKFFEWAFIRNRGEAIAKHWEMIPDDVDILITHGPPYGIMDVAPRMKPEDDPHQGCKDLSERIARLPNLKLHIFGHIHEGYGREEHNGVTYVNASKGYHPISNPPIVVDI